MNRQLIGYSDLFLAQIAVAVNTVAGKYLLAHMPVYLYLGIRFWMTSLLLLAMMRILKVGFVDVDHPRGRMTVRDWGLMAAASLCAGPLFNVLMMLGMKYTTATSAGIVMSTLPAMLALFSFWLLGEMLSKRKLFGVGLAILGVMILSLDSTKGASDTAAGSLLGDFLIFLAVIPEAMYSVFLKLLKRRVTTMGAAVIINLLSTLFVLPVAIYGAFHMDWFGAPALVWWILPITWIAGVGFYWLWARGLEVIPTSTAGLFGGVMPVATSVIAVLFLSEVFTLYDGAGMSLVLLSILIGTGARIRLGWRSA
jgi:drug/metabolite transporter (DMT)-like permease